MEGYWRKQTRAGVFTIKPRDDGRFVLGFEREALGSYHSPFAALSDLLEGAVPLPPGIDPASLGVPAELIDWDWRDLSR